MATVIRERIANWPEPDTFVFHLTGEPFDPDALWQPILCGDDEGIALPHREQRPVADVCPQCLDAKRDSS